MHRSDDEVVASKLNPAPGTRSGKDARDPELARGHPATMACPLVDRGSDRATTRTELDLADVGGQPQRRYALYQRPATRERAPRTGEGAAHERRRQRSAAVALATWRK